MFLRLHWIKILVGVALAALVTVIALFVAAGLREWSGVDAVTRQRTVAGMPFQLFTAVIMGLVSAVMFGLMWLFVIQGGMARSFTRSNASAVKGDAIGVHWSDVIGMEEAKKEAREVVRLIKDAMNMKLAAVKILRGVLLLGPPGCGKTYLAKAIATEAGLPFLSLSGSDFVEMFVGVGAGRVRKLFKQARELAAMEGGCVIFIDEIDAMGMVRSQDAGFGGRTEHNNTLNQLLAEMDGVRSKADNIVVFAATNMKESYMDEALLRPGRFDRKIVVDLPDMEDRKRLFEYYLSKTAYDKETVKVEQLAQSTVGSSPAQIANMVHEAQLISERNRKPAIGIEDLTEARERISLGIKRIFKLSEDEKARLAYYEAGHILVTYLLVPTKDVFKATILPRGADVVSALLTEKEEVLSRDKNLLMAEVRISLAGYACEKIKFSVTSDNSEKDLAKASELIHSMVYRWGMGKSGHIGNFDGRFVSIHMQQDLDKDVQETMEQCTQEITTLLRANWEIIERLVAELIANNELDYHQIETIFNAFGKERPTKEVVRLQERRPIQTGITWADVIGMEETKQEAREVVELIRDRARLQAVGGKIIKGLLMFGPPGCGKTYLASAMATEFGLPFLYKSGSEFVEMYVGVGAMRIRRMFHEARELAQAGGGCVIFIDEIDALGAKRSTDMGTGGQSEYNQTLNQLLVEMDGLKQQYADFNIIVIGATNMREDHFDPALLRPGRFDRKLHIYLPNLEDREKLFTYYLSKVQYDGASVRVDKMARITAQYSPADIANLVHEAAILCVRNKKDKITMQEIVEAMERIQLGLRLRFQVTGQERRRTAYHEAGHAIITYLCEPKRDTFKLSIVQRERTLGVSWSSEKDETRKFDKNEARARIMCSLGGYVAERIKFGFHASGVSGDFENMLTIAHQMVYMWGAGDSGFLGNFMSVYGGEHSGRPVLSDGMKAKLDADVQKILQDCLKETEQILKREEPLMDRLAGELLAKEELDYDQMEAIFKEFGKERPRES
ncbi:MAG: AAA family ATPase [Deltaproteobacteria bacterium]